MYQRFTNSLKGFAIASFLTVMCCSLVATSFAQMQKNGNNFVKSGVFTTLAGVATTNVLMDAEPCDVDDAGTITVGDWDCSGATPEVLLVGSAANPTGGVYMWEYSADNGASWTTVDDGNTQNITVTASGMYRRGYKAAPDQGCDYYYTAAVTVTKPSDVTLSPITFETHVGETSVSVCKGSRFYCNFSASEEASHVVWQASSDNGANWSDMEASYRVDSKMLFRYEYTISPTCKIASDVFTVNVNRGPRFISFEYPTDLCARTSYEVKANYEVGDAPIVSYEWSDDATGNTEIGTIITTKAECSKTYYFVVGVTDGNGCTAGAGSSFTTNDGIFSLVGVMDQPAARGTNDCEYLIPDLVTLVSGIVQSDCPVAITQSPAVNAQIEAGTEMMVAVKVKNTCGDSTTVNVKVIAPAAPVIVLTSDATDNVICHGEAVNFTATVTLASEDMSIASIEWSDNVTPSETGLEAVAPAATTASALLPVANEYRVTVKASDGCTAQDQLTVTTLPKADTISSRTAEICAPNGYEFTPAGVPANTTYTWTVTANTDETNNAADQTTAQTNFNVNSLTNTTLAYQTVTYKVTPTTTTTVNEQEYSCVGEDFNIVLTVKPSITTEGAITDFTNPDVEITLWYGACDTAYYVQEPTYVNHIAEYDGEIVLSNDKATAVNEGTILGRIAPGTYTIVWRLTDPCGNYVEYPQKFIVSYPACGTELTATDVDGNTYETVRIGCECWTKSNLRTTTGATFANVYTAAEVPAVDEETFGLLYTWYSAMGVAENDNTAVPTVLNATGSNYPYVQGICPEGWAVPSAAAYQQIAADANALKSTDANAWLPGSTATNTTGFSAVGAGYYDASSERYVNMLGETYYWSAETTSVVNGTCSALTQTCPQAIVKDQVKGQGFSVRCVKRDNE